MLSLEIEAKEIVFLLIYYYPQSKSVSEILHLPPKAVVSEYTLMYTTRSLSVSKAFRWRSMLESALLQTSLCLSLLVNPDS